MTRRLAGILLIFLGASLAWIVLGVTISTRTGDADAKARGLLDGQWGTSQTQTAPRATASVPRTFYNAAKQRPERRLDTVDIPIDASAIDVTMDLEQRQKGLLWYNLYTVHFTGSYSLRNTSPADSIAVAFRFPESGGNFTDIHYSIDGRPIDTATAGSGNPVTVSVAPGKTAHVLVRYASRGDGSWIYAFAKSGGTETVNNFKLTMRTNFDAIDFPAQTLLPTTEQRNGAGWLLEWNFPSIVTSNQIGLAIPEPLQPGPLAQRITFWAPVSLLFYFFVLVVIVTLRKIDLHPYNYFFLACAFFSFHLLFAYLVDRMPIAPAFAICAIVSMALTISYLRLVAGLRFAAVESGIAQLIYLVLFSLALFNEGWSGLTITVGAILTLFAVMQLTGRIRWSDYDRRERAVPLPT